MLLEEFDMDEYIKMERRDSYADGHEDGLAEGKRLEQLHVVHNLFQKSIPAENCADLLALENPIYINIDRLDETTRKITITRPGA